MAPIWRPDTLSTKSRRLAIIGELLALCVHPKQSRNAKMAIKAIIRCIETNQVKGGTHIAAGQPHPFKLPQLQWPRGVHNSSAYIKTFKVDITRVNERAPPTTPTI